MKLSRAALFIDTVVRVQSANGAVLRDSADEKAAAVVAQLTLEEKVAQLLNVVPAIPRGERRSVSFELVSREYQLRHARRRAPDFPREYRATLGSGRAAA